MKLSSAFLLLLATSSPFNKFGGFVASSSDLLADGEGNALRGGANIITETKKNLAEQSDRILAGDDDSTMVRDSRQGEDQGLPYEAEDTHDRQLRLDFSNVCPEGSLMHLNECESAGDCCSEEIFEEDSEGNKKWSKLLCRWKSPSSAKRRCHAIHSDNIKWSLLCPLDSKTHLDRCDPEATNTNKKCCSREITFDDITYSLYCGKKEGDEENSKNRCREQSM